MHRFRIALVGATVAVLLHVQAREVAPWELRARGLRFGIGGRTLVGPDAQRAAPQLGINAGGFALFGLTGFAGGELGLQLELLYSQHTVEQEIPLGAGEYTLRYDLAYLELPVMVRFARPFGEIELAPHAGVVPAVRIGGRLEQRVGTSPPRKLEADFSPADVGILIGVGSEFVFRRSARLFVDLRFQWGMLSVLRQEFKPLLREEKPLRALRRASYGVTVGIGF